MPQERINEDFLKLIKHHHKNILIPLRLDDSHRVRDGLAIASSVVSAKQRLDHPFREWIIVDGRASHRVCGRWY
jgi:hypothetical protein